MRSALRILIAGCGYVGSELGSALAAGGHKVFGLRRNPGALPSSIHPVAVDLSKKISPADVPADLDFVLYTASAGGSDDEAYKAAYVDGPRNLIEALASRGEDLQRFFFTSSTGVYGQSDGEWVNESSPTEPETFSGRRLLEGERIVNESPFPATVLRLAGIYGPGRTRSIGRALEDPAGDPAVYSNRIHRDDCVGVLRHLMLLPEPDRIYLGVDSEPTDRRAVAEWLSCRLGEPLPESSGAISAPRRLRTNKRCSNARLLSSGYEFLYPTFREGFAGLLDEVRG